MAFAKLKTLLRKAAARTYDQLWRAVGHVCDPFTDEACHSFFKAAGYKSNQTRYALARAIETARMAQGSPWN